MAKLFIQDMPTREELHLAAQAVRGAQTEVDSDVLYSNLLFMKVATELEIRMDSLLAEYNLTSGRFTLLFLLHKNPEGMMPSMLSQKVGVTQATISGLLNSLEKAELIARETHQSDGRSYVIRLTQKGEQTIKDIFPRWYPVIQAVWGPFSEQERSSLNMYFDQMLQRTYSQKIGE